MKYSFNRDLLYPLILNVIEHILLRIRNIFLYAMYVYSAYPSILKFFITVEAFTSLSLTNMKNVNCSSPNYFYIFKKSYSSYQLSVLIR